MRALQFSGLAGLFNGLFWELWNWGSAHPANPVTNPNLWAYHVPWVDAFHIGEMPILGFAGYLPFGVEVWVIFACVADLFGFSSRLLPE